jgi:hypothetical protein
MLKDWQSVYFQLGALIAETPNDLAGPSALSLQSLQWVGRACVLVEQVGNTKDIISIRSASDLLGGLLREMSAQQIQSIVHRSFATAELNAPVGSQGAFIPVGHAFDAFSAIGKLVAPAKFRVMIVDPYMDEKALTDFAPLIPEFVSIQLLVDEKDHKAGLLPAKNRWLSQYGTARPLELRVASARTLHDRLINVDGKDVWSLTQSLNAFATRAPATILKVDSETAKLKINFYDQMWQAAKSI